MTKFLARHIATVQKAAIVFLLLWFVFMLVLFWRLGDVETREAVLTGKRFIIHTADGRVEGAVIITPNKNDDEVKIEAPAASEPIAADASAVTSIQASSSPIAEVSEDLIDRSVGVPLPHISAAGVKPWQYYTKSFRRQNELPLVAIVITGLGQGKNVTEMALKLDDRISLSFSPYSVNVASWAAASRLTGHEMFIDLPVQTTTFPNEDPGPHSILLSRSNTENMKNLYWAMSRFQGYAGLVAPSTEVLTQSQDSYVPIAEELERRGVMFLVGHPAMETGKEESDKKNASKAKNIVSLNADVWIDEELTDMAIQARLATLEQIAQRNGKAIGVIRAYPLSIGQIEHWQKTVGERGVVLAPASFLAKLRFN